MEQDFELASQVKSWYDMESYGALKQVDPRSAADAQALDILENTTVENGKSTLSECFGLMITSNCQQLLLGAGLIKIFGKAANERPDFKGKVFKYHQSGLRQGLRSKGQRRL